MFKTKSLEHRVCRGIDKGSLLSDRKWYGELKKCQPLEKTIDKYEDRELTVGRDDPQVPKALKNVQQVEVRRSIQSVSTLTPHNTTRPCNQLDRW